MVNLDTKAKGCGILDYPRAWIDYLIYFHTDQDFFECHEVLEEHWKEEGMTGNLWPGLIQIAVGLYHQRRGNMNGAKRMFTSGIEKLATVNAELAVLGIESVPLFDHLTKRKSEIDQGLDYQTFILPLTADLLKVCQDEAIGMGKVWGLNTAPDDSIVHKHKLRDRSQVIQEREQQKRTKNRFIQ
jgi:predicted metal-dependent hydrolase